MSGETSTLLGTVSRHDERPLFIHEGKPFTSSTLSQAAQAIRRDHPELASASVALQSSSACALLNRLIALDGFANSILLLAPCMSGPALKQLLSSAGVDYFFTDKGVAQVTSKVTEESAGKNTEWLFTTSGTSGIPKLFSHTLRSLTVTTKPPGASSDDYRYGLAYQAHRFAGIQVVLQALVSGSTLVLPPSTDIGAMAECFVRQQVNTLSATPSQWRFFLSQGIIRQCALRQITLGGEIADQAILSALARNFPRARIVHIYASTEAGVGFSVADGRAGFPAAWLERGPPCEMKVSANGSLLIRSPAMSHSEGLRHRLTEEGYLDTEDAVHVKDDRVHFLGRASGVINVGGNKVHPEEVENLVREIPGVENARVIGRSSPIMGQLVCLEVQTARLSDQESGELKSQIREHCRRHLPNYKVPALINIVQELALSESGKVDRKQSQ